MGTKIDPCGIPVLFFSRWIQYHYYGLKLLFDFFHIGVILLRCKIFQILHRIQTRILNVIQIMMTACSSSQSNLYDIHLLLFMQ